MENPRLVPTRIIDRNGKRTTVHRRAATAAGSSSVPAPQTPVQEAARRQIRFMAPSWAADWIAESAPGKATPARWGGADLTDDEMFAYLRLGATLSLGAAMHAAHPDPAHWEHCGAAGRSSGHTGPLRTYSVGASVELMRAMGHSPESVETMTENGLADIHLRGVLTPEQTVDLFTKLNCASSTPSDKDAVDAMATFLTDGTMPIALVLEDDWSRRALKDLAHFAAMSRAADGYGMTGPGFHAAAEQDPSLWRTMAALLDAEPGPPPAARVWSALMAYGAEDCLRFGAQRLLAVTDTGLPLGDVIREVRAHGMDDDGIEGVLRAHGDRASVLLAIARGESAPAVADGWL